MKPAKAPRTPIDLSSITLHNTMWRGAKKAVVIHPVKFYQSSRNECLMLDKDGKVWRTSNGLYRRTADDLPLAAKRVLASWGLFTKDDIKAAEDAREERDRLRSRRHWCELLEDSAHQLRIQLTKEQLKKIEVARRDPEGTT